MEEEAIIEKVTSYLEILQTKTFFFQLRLLISAQQEQTKGQLISKCPFGVSSFAPKYQWKNLTISALESKKWWNQQNTGTFL